MPQALYRRIEDILHRVREFSADFAIDGSRRGISRMKLQKLAIRKKSRCAENLLSLNKLGPFSRTTIYDLPPGLNLVRLLA